MAPRAPGGNQLTQATDVLARVRAVPEGFVAAYSDICPGAPRHAGRVLAECQDPSLPWHRVVRADGSLAKGDRQRRLLVAEGVPFRGARVEMHVARVSADALDDLTRSR
jgi:alkylated DNA nucleotide flippase Atl1